MIKTLEVRKLARFLDNIFDAYSIFPESLFNAKKIVVKANFICDFTFFEDYLEHHNISFKKWEIDEDMHPRWGCTRYAYLYELNREIFTAEDLL